MTKKMLRRARARHDKTEKNVRATRCAVFMFENRVCSHLPSHFEVPPMLSNVKLVNRADPGAIERTSRACEANDVRIDLSADVAHRYALRALNALWVTTRVHMQQKKPENARNRVRRPSPGTSVRKQGGGTPLRRAYTSRREGLCPFGAPPRKLRLEP